MRLNVADNVNRLAGALIHVRKRITIFHQRLGLDLTSKESVGFSSAMFMIVQSSIGTARSQEIYTLQRARLGSGHDDENTGLGTGRLNHCDRDLL